MNADERRFIESVADFHNYFMSLHALFAACLLAPRLGEERGGGGGKEGFFEVHSHNFSKLNFHNLLFLF
jgi:hypothetical protein